MAGIGIGAAYRGGLTLPVVNISSRLVLLGTAGGPTPKLGRSAPAQVLVVDGHSYVIDCGNGVAHQLIRAGIPLDTITGLFVTHHHSDHNADYGSLLLLAWASGMVRPVTTVGPPPLHRMTEAVFDLHEFDIATRIADEGRPPLRPLISAREVTAPGLVYQDERVRVTAALVDHPPIPVALAYRFDAADRSVVISGDTAPSSALVDLAAGADVLVHECIHLPAVEAMIAGDRHAARLREHLQASHTSVTDAGMIAAKAGVGTLVLSHIVPADLDETLCHQLAAEHFPGTVVVGADLMQL